MLDENFARDVGGRLLKDNTCCVPKVTSFSIVDAASKTVIGTVVPGSTENEFPEELLNINIRAEVDNCNHLPVRSVEVGFSDDMLRRNDGRCERFAPYTIFGGMSVD